jgi:hypothetical protein
MANWVLISWSYDVNTGHPVRENAILTLAENATISSIVQDQASATELDMDDSGIDGGPFC